jgi:putative flippase GtrA
MLKNIFTKYREILLYLFFGGMTTLVNYISYALFTDIFHINYLISNALAWLLSVLFAYITNKIYVFESKTTGFSEILKELSAFIGCRIFSGVIDMAVMYIGVNLLSLNDKIIKIAANVIVVILNYVFSKLFIFKKK